MTDLYTKPDTFILRSEIERIASRADLAEAQLASFKRRLAAAQRRLGPEFERILIENLPELYER